MKCSDHATHECERAGDRASIRQSCIAANNEHLVQWTRSTRAQHTLHRIKYVIWLCYAIANAKCTHIDLEMVVLWHFVVAVFLIADIDCKSV